MVRVRVYVQLFIILITAGLLGAYVYANGAHANPGASWSAGEPTAHVNERAHTDSTVNNSSCSVEEIPVVNYSNGRIDLEEVCLTKANGMRYGSYSSESSSYQKRFVVSFGLDSKAYMINGFPAHTGIIPIPGTNDLFVRYNGGGHNAILRYSNLPSLLNRHEVEGQMRGYNFKGSVPGARIVDHPYGARSIGISENGKWALVEVVEKGILKVNLVTGEKRYVTNHNTHYGFHSLGDMRLAISDDGVHGAIIYSSLGLNAFVIEMDGNCGRLVDASEKYGKIPNPCREVSLKTASESTGARLFDYIRPPSFSAEGKVLHAWLQFSGSGNQSIKRVDFHANGYEPKRLEYLALGDSYSSGEGDTETIGNSDVKWYRYGTDVEEKSHLGIPREKCHISMRSYPYLLAKSMDLSLNSQWQTVACSGATAWDVKAQGSGDYWGQNNDNVPRLINYTNRETLKFAALDDFTPGRQKQIEFVKKYQPKVITITMGGNDIGFGDKIKVCASPMTYEQTCRYAKPSERGAVKNQIIDQYDNLKSLYEEIYKASGGQSKVYAVSYPHFINSEKEATCGKNIGRLNNEERVLIGNSIDLMNATIKQAASAAGVGYLDISDSLTGHRLCDPDEQYVTGIAFRRGNELQESFHPNAKGSDKISRAIVKATCQQNLLQYDECFEQKNSRPNPQATKDNIEVPDYFRSTSDARSRYERVSASKVTIGESLDIASSQYTFLPQSSAKVVLHSDPFNLGSYKVDVDGSLSVSVDIPADFPVGYHTLIISGEAYSGGLIELEQVILVEGNNPEDIDNNGIPDTEQACGPFITSSGLDDDLDGIDDACDPIISMGEASPDLPEAIEDEKILTDIDTDLEEDLGLIGADPLDAETHLRGGARAVNAPPGPSAPQSSNRDLGAHIIVDSRESVLGSMKNALIPFSEQTSLAAATGRDVVPITSLVNYMYGALSISAVVGSAYIVLRKKTGKDW